MAAAEDLFACLGFTATNVDQIARKCGMSKQTLYGLFTSKEALFAALVQDSVPTVGEGLESIDTGDLENDLITLLESMAKRALSSRQVTMTRLVIEEAHATPELRERFCEKSVSSGRRFLADQVGQLENRYDVTFGDDPVQLSDILYGAVAGGMMMHALIGDNSILKWEATASRIRQLAHMVVTSAKPRHLSD